MHLFDPPAHKPKLDRMAPTYDGRRVGRSRRLGALRCDLLDACRRTQKSDRARTVHWWARFRPTGL